jgi:hypothetical protein
MTSHRQPRSLRPLQRTISAVLALLVALTALVAVSGVAVANFHATGSGTGTATTGTLAAPTGVAGAQTVGTGNVTVTWTASTGTPTPTGYYVMRVPSSGPNVPACGSSASSSVAGWNWKRCRRRWKPSSRNVRVTIRPTVPSSPACLRRFPRAWRSHQQRQWPR